MEASYLRRANYRGRLLLEGQPGVYHVVSRSACGQLLFDEEAKGIFIDMLRKQAGFCGVEVLAYIDLNPVRAELVLDPADYAYSSFGAAMRGHRYARHGYVKVFCGKTKWSKLLPDYRVLLYGEKAVNPSSSARNREQLERVLESGDQLPLHEILRLRVRYFTAGTAIGSDAFLRDIGKQWKTQHGMDRKRDAYPMRCGEWGSLRTFRNLQVRPVE